MNWMELFGAVGGLIGFVSQFAAKFVGYFAAPQFASYVANRLYTWSEPENVTRVFRPELLEDSDDEEGALAAGNAVGSSSSPKKKREARDQEHIMFLGMMGLRRLWYRALCGMCSRKKYWNTYMATLNRVENDMAKQMDIVKLIRRLRAHGFALSMFMEAETLKAISKKSKGLPAEVE